MIKKENRKFGTSEVIFLVLLTCIMRFIVGLLINFNIEQQSPSNDEMLDEFIKNYNYILDKYYGEIGEEELLKGALEGMLNVLEDDYSTLIDSETSNNFNINLEGSYEGLGIEITNDSSNNIIIYRVIDDSPAFTAGLKSGDIVKSIDNKNLTDKDKSELSNYVKNSNQKEFDLEIIRDNQIMHFKVERKYITLKSTSSKIIEKNNKKIGYIYISIFSNKTDEQFKTELEKLEKQNIDSLIIDVRDNAGGHLSTVSNILSMFMDSSHIIYQTEVKNDKTKFYSSGKINKEYPIVILQNENSASASELLSISLKENMNAVVIGKTSYGKGTVQELVNLTSGDEYKFTTKKWLSPKGNWIHEKGITPDIDIELNEQYYNEPIDENDNQLQTAIEHLTK